MAAAKTAGGATRTARKTERDEDRVKATIGPYRTVNAKKIRFSETARGCTIILCQELILSDCSDGMPPAPSARRSGSPRRRWPWARWRISGRCANVSARRFSRKCCPRRRAAFSMPSRGRFGTRSWAAGKFRPCPANRRHGLCGELASRRPAPQSSATCGKIACTGALPVLSSTAERPSHSGQDTASRWTSISSPAGRLRPWNSRNTTLWKGRFSRQEKTRSPCCIGLCHLAQFVPLELVEQFTRFPPSLDAAYRLGGLVRD